MSRFLTGYHVKYFFRQEKNDMSLIPTSERMLLPRWRLFHAIENFAELDQVFDRPFDVEDKIDHINAVEAWRATNNLENAIELCSSAIVNGKFKDARESAAFILDGEPRSRSVVAMANKVLNPEQKIQSVVLDSPHAHIANLRKKIHQSLANPVLWVDLAFWYSSLGQNHKAERAIKNALILAPHNRFIVRCAARFFMHIDKVSEARFAVEKYQFLKHDPWVLAIELSIQKRRSKYLKLSKAVIEKHRVSEFHSSELASALGTVEMSSGAIKKAVKLFGYSLRTPTNNSIAQAQWIENEHKLGIPLNDATVSSDIAHEAQFYQFLESGKWNESMKLAERWAQYEPYSTRAIMYMSYISLVCQNDPVNCIVESKKGLQLRKNDFFFLNNLVVSYAHQGEIEKAEEKFALINKQNLDKKETTVYNATKGLLAFKHGNVDEGRKLYQGAVNELQVKHKNVRGKNLALLFWAREEILSQTDRAHSFFNEIQRKIEFEKNKDVLAFKEHTKKLLHGKDVK